MDIREWPAEEGVSADATVWPTADILLERAKKELGLKENRLQLLNVTTHEEFKRMEDIVNESGNAVLLRMTISASICGIDDYGTAKQDMEILNSRAWKSLGYDVCDLNGFFSFAHMGVLNCPLLFQETDLLQAFELTQVANLTIREHSPFVVVGLSVAE